MRSLPVITNDSTILQRGYLSRRKKVGTGEYSFGNVFYNDRSQLFATEITGEAFDCTKDMLKKETG